MEDGPWLSAAALQAALHQRAAGLAQLRTQLAAEPERLRPAIAG